MCLLRCADRRQSVLFRRALTPLLALFFVVILGAPAFAQPGARLKMCNTGHVPVEVAVASNILGGFIPGYWIIRPYSIGPGDCALVYDEVGYERANCGTLR